ncbi:MAG: toll/interleukin-1 receptor domain-containing protein, partial [Pseudomonadota bacterium]
MADVFISYKREDRETAEKLSRALTAMGFSVWWDFELLSGENYRHVIRAVIDQAAACIVLWSPKAVESRFVVDEATHADKTDKLLPAFIAPCEPPFGFGGLHGEDLTTWSGAFTHPGFTALLK